MTKIVLKKTTSAIFLAIVLIAGTFAAISPSFVTIVDAQAISTMHNNYEPDYGMDNAMTTSNHMENTTATINPKIVVMSNVTISM